MTTHAQRERERTEAARADLEARGLTATNAATVSRVLAAAGLPRAGRYTAVGYVDRDGKIANGFISTAKFGTFAVAVLFTHDRNVDRARLVASAVAALYAAGYAVEINPDRTGAPWSLTVHGRHRGH